MSMIAAVRIYLGLRKRDYTMFKKNKKNRLIMGIGSIAAYISSLAILIVNVYSRHQHEACYYSIDSVYYTIAGMTMVSCGIHLGWSLMPISDGFTEGTTMISVHFYMLSTLMSFIGALVVMTRVQSKCKVQVGYIVYYWIYTIAGIGYLIFYLIALPIAGTLNIRDMNRRLKCYQDMNDAIEELRELCSMVDLDMEQAKLKSERIIDLYKGYNLKNKQFGQLPVTLMLYLSRYESYMPEWVQLHQQQNKFSEDQFYARFSQTPPAIRTYQKTVTAEDNDTHMLVSCTVCHMTISGRYVAMPSGRYHSSCLWSMLNTPDWCACVAN